MRAVDPVRLFNAQDCIGDLLRRWLRGEHRRVGMNYPSLVELRDLKMLIWTRILDLSGGAVIDDETQIANRRALCGIHRDIEIDAETIGARDGYLALAPHGVFRRRVPRVEGPARVVAIGSKIVDAHFSGWNRRISLRRSLTDAEE